MSESLIRFLKLRRAAVNADVKRIEVQRLALTRFHTAWTKGFLAACQITNSHLDRLKESRDELNQAIAKAEAKGAARAAAKELAERIIDRERLLWERLADPRLYRFVTVWTAYLIETWQVPESLLDDVVLLCKQNPTGILASARAKLFVRMFRRHLQAIGQPWPTLPQMRAKLAKAGVDWQLCWGWQPK